MNWSFVYLFQHERRNRPVLLEFTTTKKQARQDTPEISECGNEKEAQKNMPGKATCICIYATRVAAVDLGPQAGICLTNVRQIMLSDPATRGPRG